MASVDACLTLVKIGFKLKTSKCLARSNELSFALVELAIQLMVDINCCKCFLRPFHSIMTRYLVVRAVSYRARGPGYNLFPNVFISLVVPEDTIDADHSGHVFEASRIASKLE